MLNIGYSSFKLNVMQKKLLLLKLVLLLFTYVNVNAQDIRPSATISAKQARILATDQLPNVLQWMEPEDLHLYGFSSTDDFSRITVGRPYYLSTMEDISGISRDIKGTLPIKSMMLPLILENTVRCFIFLSLEDNEWKAVGLGSREYAVKGGKIFNKIDDNASLIIGIPQLSEEFIEENLNGISLYKPIFRFDKELKKEGLTMNELRTLFIETLKKVK